MSAADAAAWAAYHDSEAAKGDPATDYAAWENASLADGWRALQEQWAEEAAARRAEIEADNAAVRARAAARAAAAVIL